MEEEVLRAGEAVINRRKQSLKRREKATAVGSDTCRRVNWFKTMLSLPPRKTLTTLETFTARSAFVAYFAGGVLGVAFPQILNFALFEMKLRGRDIEYVRLNCALLAIIGFLYIVTARSRPRILGNGAILGTVPVRLVFVPAVFTWMYQHSLVPCQVAVAIILLDSTLAMATLIVWYRDTPGASVGKSLGEIADVVIPILSAKRNWSSNCIQIIGYLKATVSLSFAANTEIARDALGLDTFGEFSKGIVALLLITNAVIGWQQILGGGNGNESTPLAALFYRLVWSMPLVAVMHYLQCIERGLALAIGTADSVSVLLILISLAMDSLSPKKTN